MAGHSSRLADQYKLPFLGEIPIDLVMRKSGDAGTPIAVSGTPEQKGWYEKLADGLLPSLEARA